MKAAKQQRRSNVDHPFKLGQEHLPFPNGGGLKLMASKTPESHKLEIEALEAKHKVEFAKLKEKHAAANKPRPISVKAKKNV
jgi:hypothetical protein